MSRTIELDQFIARAPDVVWRALTEPELLARWWATGDIKPIVGHRFTLDMGSWGQQPCEVLEVQAGRLLRYTFAEGTLDTTITWRLVPEGDGTRLFLEHAGFTDERAFRGMGGGWPTILGRMTAQLP
ncbi:SRPBCC family protein [Nucisporomicrobium flavum]|uniref:SRPBCC family protein n=1 Tax=Nucisporomicrobium flavum TaxID=2785915 RepID=UPI0027DD0401|nr:SRPBCC domain-containing protein [Nucisporomicrobium flavum]